MQSVLSSDNHPEDEAETSSKELSDQNVSLGNLANKLSRVEEKLLKVDAMSDVVENDIQFLTASLQNQALEIDELTESVNGCNGMVVCEDEDNNTSFLDKLPVEIIQKIMSYLSPEELCRKVALVCKRWYKYAYDPVLWKTLHFKVCPDISSYMLLRTVKRACYLRRLILRNRTELTLAEVSILTEYCPLLQEIDLGFCFTFNKSMLDCFVTNCRNLDSINVEGCKLITDDCMPVLIKAEKLKHFNFSHCSILDESIVYLAENMKRVVSLNIDGISWITDIAVTTLVKYHKDYLENLELDGAELTDESIETVSKCQNLRMLSVSFCELLTDKSLRFIQEMKFNQHPKCLKLRKGMEFKPLALRDLFLSQFLKYLHTLELSECTRLLDDGVIQMCKCCGHNLQTLHLSWCWNITDTGLVAIIDHCSKLRFLDLIGIDKIRGECLHRIPEDMTHLEYLDLRQCSQIIDDIIVEVIKRKPDLKVLNYYGEEFVYCASDTS